MIAQEEGSHYGLCGRIPRPTDGSKLTHQALPRSIADLTEHACDREAARTVGLHTAPTPVAPRAPASL